MKGAAKALLNGHDPRIESWRLGDVEIVAGSMQGHQRPENQDVYAVHKGPPLRVGVFDGVGGLPNGRQAAKAAAASLGTPASNLIEALHDAVKPTRGASTAAIAELHDHCVTLTLIGDSAAYQFDDGFQRIGRPHACGGQLTQALGAGGRGSQITLPFDAPFLLCTDGILLPAESFAEPGPDLAGWAASVLNRARAAGNQDDATLVMVRRLA